MFSTEDQKKIISSYYPDRASEYNEILESFGEFVEKEILPTAEKTDKQASFPKESIEKTFRQGFTNISYPEEIGGLGLPYPIYIACMELLGKACASTAISMAIHGTMCDGVFQFGSRLQHEKYLRDLIKGEKLGAFCLTESGGGSDAGAMTSKAEKTPEGWKINGSKMYITNVGKADYYLVFAKSEAGFVSLIVPAEAKGFSIGSNIPKMGLRGSTLMGFNLDNVVVPVENQIGNDGEGFEYAKKMLYGGRITIAALSVGIAQMALEKIIAYSKERKAFGHELADFQNTRFKAAECATEIDIARLATYYAAYLKGSREAFENEACEAKLFASEMALKVCDTAIQVHGGFGYTDESDVHRHWRDAKLMTIGEGTSEVMKMIISNNIF